jgi:hypothetical protein
MIYFSLNYVVLCTRPSRPRPQLYDMDGRYHSQSMVTRWEEEGRLLVLRRVDDISCQLVTMNACHRALENSQSPTSIPSK